jgi:hypothetical protein
MTRFQGYELHQLRRPMGDLPAGYWVAALPTAESWRDHDYSGPSPYAIARQISEGAQHLDPWELPTMGYLLTDALVAQHNASRLVAAH